MPLQDKKLTSLSKRSVELQARRESGDGDHESEDLSEDTGENIRQVVHKSANRYTIVSLDTRCRVSPYVVVTLQLRKNGATPLVSLGFRAKLLI